VEGGTCQANGVLVTAAKARAGGWIVAKRQATTRHRQRQTQTNSGAERAGSKSGISGRGAQQLARQSAGFVTGADGDGDGETLLSGWLGLSGREEKESRV
jgi:hypothetical protein